MTPEHSWMREWEKRWGQQQGQEPAQSNRGGGGNDNNDGWNFNGGGWGGVGDLNFRFDAGHLFRQIFGSFQTRYGFGSRQDEEEKGRGGIFRHNGGAGAGKLGGSGSPLRLPRPR